MPTLNLSSLPIKRSIQETISWCEQQSITAVAEETEEIPRGRSLMSEANQAFQKAQKRSDRSWFGRDVRKTRDWKLAMKLLRQADPDSLALLATQLRSSKLQPSLPLHRVLLESERENIVNGVIATRSELINSTTISQDERTKGRFLICIPEDSVSDGAARYASQGFFDPDDAPPWDLWLHYSDRKLLSWVPIVLVPLAQAGIDANAVECIYWADQVR